MVRHARPHEAHRRRAGPKKIAPRPCRMANLKSFGAANVRPKISLLMHNLSGLCSLPFSGRTLSVESQPRIWRRASPAVVFFSMVLFGSFDSRGRM
jgi:hypothetical protein